MDRPLIAVEDPPDFPGQSRTHRYRVLEPRDIELLLSLSRSNATT